MLYFEFDTLLKFYNLCARCFVFIALSSNEGSDSLENLLLAYTEYYVDEDSDHLDI